MGLVVCSVLALGWVMVLVVVAGPSLVEKGSRPEVPKKVPTQEYIPTLRGGYIKTRTFEDKMLLEIRQQKYADRLKKSVQQKKRSQ